MTTVHIPYTTHVWLPSREATYCGIAGEHVKANQQDEEFLDHEAWLKEGSTETGNICVRCARGIVKDYKTPENSYEERARGIGALTDEKNAAYGSSFDRAGDVLKQLYPNGITPEKFGDALVGGAGRR